MTENSNLPSESKYVQPGTHDERLKHSISIRQQLAEKFHQFSEIKALSPSDREALFNILYKAQQGDFKALDSVYKLVYDELPVDMEEFVYGRRFLNLKGRVDPEKVEILYHFDKPQTRKAWIAAGSGSGKSFMVSCAMAKTIYNLLCLKKPDMYYLLGPGARISILNLSVSKEQAKDVIFAQFLARIGSSDWFRGKYKPWTSKAQFKKNIFAFSGGSGATTVYGYDTIMGSLDEASWLVDRNDRSVSEELCEAMLKSLNTRFPLSYKLFVISSLRSPDDFLHSKIMGIKEEGVPIKVTETYQP